MEVCTNYVGFMQISSHICNLHTYIYYVCVFFYIIDIEQIDDAFQTPFKECTKCSDYFLG